MTVREPIKDRTASTDDSTDRRCRGIALSQGTSPNILKPGAVKGRLIFYVQSVREFLSRQMAESEVG